MRLTYLQDERIINVKNESKKKKRKKEHKTEKIIGKGKKISKSPN